jgi:hypothetical protein
MFHLYVPNRIFPIPEIEDQIFSYLDPVMYIQKISLINHYYHKNITSTPLWIELDDFFHNINTHRAKMFSESIESYNINNLSIACFNGQLTLAKFFLSTGKYNIYGGDNAAFRYACIGYNIDVYSNQTRWQLIKWLYQLYFEYPIKLGHNNFIFHKLIKYNQLDIMIWIFNLKNYPPNVNYWVSECVNDTSFWLHCSAKLKIDEVFIKSYIDSIVVH